MMKSVVVYRSKSGNTKAIAEVMANKLETKAIPVNFVEKRGRGTKEEQEKEKELFREALETCKDATLVIIGTPVSFQQAHAQIVKFCKQVETRNVGLFCTYINKMGTTLEDLKAILREKGINVLGVTDFGNLNSGQFGKLDKSASHEYARKAEGFAERCAKQIP